MNKKKCILLITLIIFVIITCINPIYPHQQYLQHAGTILLMIPLLYELFEWLLTIVMTSEQADSYNGQQGDMWDAQKDMAWALLGSTIMALYYVCKDRRKSHG